MTGLCAGNTPASAFGASPARSPACFPDCPAEQRQDDCDRPACCFSPWHGAPCWPRPVRQPRWCLSRRSRRLERAGVRRSLRASQHFSSSCPASHVPPPQELFSAQARSGERWLGAGRCAAPEFLPRQRCCLAAWRPFPAPLPRSGTKPQQGCYPSRHQPTAICRPGLDSGTPRQFEVSAAAWRLWLSRASIPSTFTSVYLRALTLFRSVACRRQQLALPRFGSRCRSGNRRLRMRAGLPSRAGPQLWLQE